MYIYINICKVAAFPLQHSTAAGWSGRAKNKGAAWADAGVEKEESFSFLLRYRERELCCVSCRVLWCQRHAMTQIKPHAVDEAEITCACVRAWQHQKTHRTGQEFYQEKADALELAKH
jgi:hypothetical protein